MSKPVNDLQFSAETWEIGASMINTDGSIVVLFKDENGIYHTVKPAIGQEIINGNLDVRVLTGEILDEQPQPPIPVEILDAEGNETP